MKRGEFFKTLELHRATRRLARERPNREGRLLEMGFSQDFLNTRSDPGLVLLESKVGRMAISPDYLDVPIDSFPIPGHSNPDTH